MAVTGWLLDKPAAARVDIPSVRAQLLELAGRLHLCPVGQLEQLYSARSAGDYDALKEELTEAFPVILPPPDVFEQALSIQHDLAHHHGMWHRVAIPDLLLAVTALHHEVGVVHIDADFDRIAEVRPLVARRLEL